jgi:hypothetical protein
VYRLILFPRQNCDTELSPKVYLLVALRVPALSSRPKDAARWRRRRRRVRIQVKSQGRHAVRIDLARNLHPEFAETVSVRVLSQRAGRASRATEPRRGGDRGAAQTWSWVSMTTGVACCALAVHSYASFSGLCSQPQTQSGTPFCAAAHPSASFSSLSAPTSHHRNMR